MVVIQLKGGLGNQMFQYALYLSYIQEGVHASLDLSHFKQPGASAQYELKRVFNINALESGTVQKVLSKILWKFQYRFSNVPYKETDERFGWYDENISKLTNAYLKGYWQCEQYFLDAADVIRRDFTFPHSLDDNNMALIERMQQCNAVGLHIRRGDYQQAGRNWAAPLSYYQNAIAFIRNKIPDPCFFIFSDSPAWVAENIQLENSVFINHNTGKQSFVDMQLMSCCQHNIIANSSFSWWAAWLNKNENKMVVAPTPWMPGMEGTRDIIPAGWHTIQH
jgi:hypothetical protein